VEIAGWPPRWLTPISEADIARGDGEHCCSVIEAFCRVTKDSVGGRVGELIRLRPWQRQIPRYLLARRPDGRYRNRQALIGVARKNAKSTLGSGIAIHSLVYGPEGSEVYSCAGDRDQARIVFGTAKRMIEMDRDLSEVCKLYRDAIAVPSMGSVYRVLSAEAYSKEGMNPTTVLFDEVHVQPNRELWDVMALAMGARLEPLMVGITTAGVRYDTNGNDSLCYTLYEYGKRVCLGEVNDPSFFMAWWEPQLADADHRDPATWREANPGYGDIVAAEDFAASVLRTPEQEFRALDVETPVLGPSGWTKMRDLVVGDEVFAYDGSPARVVGVSDVFTGRDCFRVEGEDGRVVVADAEHWWPVETYNPNTNKREFRWVTTQWIYDNPLTIKYLLTGGSVEMPVIELPIDPYILGLWLGDGNSRTSELAAHRGDVPHLEEAVAAAGYFCKVREDPTASRVYISTQPIRRHGSAPVDTLRRRLVDAGLLGSKHIPDRYLLASVQQRLALLQGLMDSDGTVGSGRARFTNTNKFLADGVLFLARSLGWKPRLRTKTNHYGNYYQVDWTAYRDDELAPFRMERKVARLNLAPALRSCAGRIKIEAVSVESRDTCCIAIDHLSHTFLAGEGLMPTGNTKRVNQWITSKVAWLPAGAWDSLEVGEIPDGDEVVLGFDGSFNGDCTCIVAASVADVPHIEVVEVWERPEERGDDWQVPILDVEDAIRNACRKWQVREVACDPYRWARTFQVLESEGLPVVEFPQSSSRMTPATTRFYEAVVNRSITRSNDLRLARHIANAYLRADSRGTRIYKEHKYSTRRIDLAVAAVMALERAAWWHSYVPESTPFFAAWR
jgi:phage terminase large subunit-like protein